MLKIQQSLRPVKLIFQHLRGHNVLSSTYPTRNGPKAITAFSLRHCPSVPQGVGCDYPSDTGCSSPARELLWKMALLATPRSFLERCPRCKSPAPISLRTSPPRPPINLTSPCTTL